MPSHMPMPKDTARERGRRYTSNEKLALVDATMQPGMTVSAVVRLHDVSPCSNATTPASNLARMP